MGQNGRVWGDDEFWMDFLIQGVGWVLLAASLVASAIFFYRQRAAAINDRREDLREIAAQELRTAQREARNRYVVTVDPLLERVSMKADEASEAVKALHAAETIEGTLEGRAAFFGVMGDYAGHMAEWVRLSIALTPERKWKDGPQKTLQGSLEFFYKKLQQLVNENDVPELTSRDVEVIYKLSGQIDFAIVMYRHTMNNWLIDGTVQVSKHLEVSEVDPS